MQILVATLRGAVHQQQRAAAYAALLPSLACTVAEGFQGINDFSLAVLETLCHYVKLVQLRLVVHRFSRIFSLICFRLAHFLKQDS